MDVELTDDNTEKAEERPSYKYFVHKAHSDLLVLSDNGRLHFPLNLKAVNSPDKHRSVSQRGQEAVRVLSAGSAHFVRQLRFQSCAHAGEDLQKCGLSACKYILAGR